MISLWAVVGNFARSVLLVRLSSLHRWLALFQDKGKNEYGQLYREKR